MLCFIIIILINNINYILTEISFNKLITDQRPADTEWQNISPTFWELFQLLNQVVQFRKAHVVLKKYFIQAIICWPLSWILTFINWPSDKQNFLLSSLLLRRSIWFSCK